MRHILFILGVIIVLASLAIYVCVKPKVRESFVAVARPTGRSSRMQSGGIDDRAIGTFREVGEEKKLDTGKRDTTEPSCFYQNSDSTLKVPIGYMFLKSSGVEGYSKSGTPIPKNCEEQIIQFFTDNGICNDNNQNNYWSTQRCSNTSASNSKKTKDVQTVIQDNETLAVLDNKTTKDVLQHATEDKSIDQSDEKEPSKTLVPTTVTSIVETTTTPETLDEYTGLVLSETQKLELDSVFKMKVEIEEPKSEVVYEEYLKTYSTPLLGMVETKTQETMANGTIEVTGNLNVFVVLASTNDVKINDELVMKTISELQKAVDEVFKKLFGYDNFPNKIKVNIFQVAYSQAITFSITPGGILENKNKQFKDEKELADQVEICHYSTVPKCPNTHHFMLVYDLSATKDTVFDHKVSNATVGDSSDANHFRKIVFSMAGAQLLCDLKDLSIKDDDAAFVKATCSADTDGTLPITDMDTAYLRRIWRIQNQIVPKVAE